MCGGGLLPNVISFHTAVSALENDGQWQHLAPFFEEMCIQGGLLPHVISFNTAIIALENVGQWKRVAPLLDDRRRLRMLPRRDTASMQPFQLARRVRRWVCKTKHICDQLQRGHLSVRCSWAVAACGAIARCHV
eukprot:3751842-Karenia_brevis.AAC.1